MNELQAKLRNAIESQGYDALMAIGADNFTYVTQTVLPFAPSYPERKALVLQTGRGDACIVCPYGWSVAIRDQGWQGDLVSFRESQPYRALLPAVTQALSEMGLTRAEIGVDLSRMPKALWDALRHHLPDVEWRACDETLRALRMVKTGAEQRLLQEAARQSQRAIVSALNHVEGTVDAVSYTLAEAAERLRVHVGEFGGSVAGHVAVVEGVDAQHVYVPPYGRLSQGNLVRLDLTNEYRGYWSSAGRTVSIGQPTNADVQAYRENLSLKAAAVELLRPGVTCQQVFWAVAERADREGIQFSREAGVGHGVGTSEREAPYLTPLDATPLQPGMVLALDVFTCGPRQELIHSIDTYVIEKDGCRLMSWYRNWDRLYAVLGATARHG